MVANTFSDDGAVIAQWKARGVRGQRGEYLAAFAVRHQHEAAFAILVEETGGNPAKSFEVAVAQRVGQGQYLQRTGHALNLGIEHQADTAHGIENALRRFLSILFVIVENDDGRKNNQRQRGSRDQKSKTHWQ